MKHKNDLGFNAKLNGKQKFGFRKLSVGLVTVALGTTFYLSNGQLVHADENSDANTLSQETTTVVSKEADTSATAAQNNSKQTEKQDNENNAANDSQTVKIADLNKNAVSADALKESKVETKSSIKEENSISADLMNSDQTKRDANGQNVMAKNDNLQIEVNYQNSRLQPNQKFDVSYQEADKWDVVGWEKGTSKDLGNAFSAINNGDGTFTITNNALTDTDASFSLHFGLQYNQDVTAATPTKVTVVLKHADAHNPAVIETKETNPVIVPYVDKVVSDEIAHGWASKVTKDVNNTNDNDGASTILADTAATQPGQDRKLMQYQIEWNYGKAGNTKGTILAPLDKAKFTAEFSKGQTLLPDTIKVFRVYQPDAVNPDGSRKDINDSYKDITKYGNEDPAFEQFLKDHLTVTEVDSTGQTHNLSWKDYQTALAKAKSDHTEPPLVNGIHLDESDMHNVHLSDGSTHNFGDNVGDNTDKTKTDPHSTFFIQMDTLLNNEMPIDWTKPGGGPSMSYNTVSGDFNGVGSKIDKTTSPVFSGGGGGFNHEVGYSATLHFADVNDKDNIVSLDEDHGVSVQEADSKVGSANITFTNAAELVKVLTDKGYQFVGISYGEKTNGKFEGSDLLTSSTYDGSQYGTFGDNHAKEIIKNFWSQDFTLNFVHQTKAVNETATVKENVNYVYGNGPKKDQAIEDGYLPKVERTEDYGRSYVEDLVTGNAVMGSKVWNRVRYTDFSAVDFPATLLDKPIYKLDKDGITSSLTSDGQKQAIFNANKQNASMSVDGSKLENGKTYTFTITVPYKLKENITVHYIDEDNNNREICDSNLHNSYLNGEPTSTTDNHTSADIAYLEGKGYVLDEDATLGKTAASADNNFKGDADGKNKYNDSKLTFDNDENADNQNYYVYLKHNHVPAENQTATITETVKYYYENGPHKSDVDAKSNVPAADLGNLATPKTITYTRTTTKDAVTGKIISYGEWTTKDSAPSPLTYADGLEGHDSDATPGKIYKLDTQYINIVRDDHSDQVVKNMQNDGTFTVDPTNLANNRHYTVEVRVPYKLTERMTISIIDEDLNNGAGGIYGDIDEYWGNPGDHSTFMSDPTKGNIVPAMIDNLEKEGYIFDSSATNGGRAHNPNLTYDTSKYNFVTEDRTGNSPTSDHLFLDNDENLNNQNYFIYVYHNIVDDVEEKTISEHIKYVDEADGHEIHDPYTSGTLTFRRDKYTDKANGKVTYSKWSVGAFKPVANPEISGYTIDPDKITEKLNGSDRAIADHNAEQIGEADFHKLTDGEITALKDGSTLDFVVPYTKNPTPTPTPSNPTNPSNPTQPSSPTTPAPVHPQTPETPKHHSQTSNVRPHATSVHSGDKGKVSTVRPHAQGNEDYAKRSKTTRVQERHYNTRVLPETGEKQDNLGLLGLAFASIAGLFGIAADRKRKN